MKGPAATSYDPCDEHRYALIGAALVFVWDEPPTAAQQIVVEQTALVYDEEQTFGEGYREKQERATQFILAQLRKAHRPPAQGGD